MKKLLRSNRNNLLHDASLHRGDTFTEKLRIAFLAVALCLISIAWSEAQTISNCPTLAATEIAGSVWKDYNYNGAKDETLVGVQGVTVKAYDCNGILVGTVTTDGSGNYKFTGMVAGQKYRIEFTLPTIVSSSYNLTKAGAGGRTTVQFVQAGQCASLGIARQEDYCEVNPLLATTCFANGDPLVNGTAGPDGALVTFDNNSIGNGTATGTDPATKVATASQIGSSFGIAWDRKNKKMLVSAFAKRHVGFGSLGEGGIYQVDYSSGAPVVSNWLDVKTLGIPVDNVGTGTTIADRNISRGLVGDKLAKSLDAAGYTAVGKTSIGNIEFNKNADTLFFVNLTNRTIYAINVGTKTLAGTYPSPTVAGCAGTFRIFALKYHEGKLFMGGVCDGTTPSNMNSKVYRLDGTTWTEIFSMTMDYSKGYAFWGSCINNTGWYPWTDTPPAACDIQGAERGFVYPTPIFSDIEFDVDGSMILAFMDRTAHQIGWRNASPTNINDTWSSFVGGDILRIYNNNGTYVLENNGTAGPNTSGGANKGQGPGGGEFYFHDFLFEPHAETSMGGLAFRKGSGEIALTAMDPFETRYDSGGINWFSNSTGASSRNQGYYVYAGPESFGKSAGLGDVEYLCGLAPIEIGNRVWIDLDKDGIQDPCEGSLPNMNVSLYKGNTLIATTKTNAQGEYYFSSKSALAVGTWSGTGADTALLTNTAYKLVFAEGQSTAGLVTLSGLGQFSISPKDVTANNGNDQNDSDVALQGGSIGINLTTGSEGASNHSFDAGFIPLSSPIFCGMLIDSLTTVQNSLTNGRVSSMQSSSILLGGERDMNFVSNIPTSSTTTLFEVGPYFAGGNVIEITNQAASSSTLTVQWDGLDGDAVNLNPTGLGGLNFAALGINRLKAQLNADFPPNTNDSLQIRLELYANAGAASRITKNFKFTSSTFNAIEFKFSDLVPFVGSGVDLSNIGAVVMFIDMSPNTVSTRTGWDVLLKDLTLECCTKPVASATPRTQTICVGGTASAFTATPSTGVEYKWYGPLADTTSSLGTAVSGATSATFTPSGAVLTTAGVKYYAVVVNTTGDVNCADTAFVRLVVNAKPVIADGSAAICAGESVDLTSKITSYNTYLSPVWTVGTANGTALTTPASVKPTGTTTYVLVAQNAAGCKDTANVVVTVNAKPSAGKDTTLACVNAATNTLATSYTLLPSPAGGSWSQLGTTPTTATISGNNVTGMSVTGTYQFIYTTTAGCKDTVAITVAPCAGCVKPNAGADAVNVCQPTKTSKLTAVTAGGTWAPIGNPANPSAATIDANGNISGLNAAGTYKFVYSVTSGGQTCTDTAQVVVLAKPVIVDGSATICAGEPVDLTFKITNYNTYLSPVWTVGTANGTAVTTPASVKPTGTTTYVLVAQNAAGCKDTANVVVTVNIKPNAGKDTTLACVNAATNTLATSYTLVPSLAGGSWSQLGTTPTTATITGNNVTGMTIAGTYQFIYTSTAGCKDTVAVTVAPCAGCVKPNAGPDAANVCQPTSTVKLTAVTAGGTWAPIGSPANPSAATIDANGNISGLNAAGTYKFVYSITSGGQTCTDTAQVVVLAKPTIADGSATICAGESVDLTSKITNYNTYLSPVWTIGTANGMAVATPSSVKPTGTTTYVLVVQNAAGCKDTANVVVTVNAKPNAGKDTTLVCSNGNVPSSVQLSATPTGGTWSALMGNPTGATVSSSGLVSITNATAQGKSFDFVYSVNGCQDTVKVIIPTCPAPCVESTISSAAPVCSNDAQTYSFTFTVNNQLGIVKVNKGTLSGSNPYTVTGIPSGQNVIIIDSLSAICKSDTIIAGVNCNCNPAVPQLLTPSLTACIGDTFPTLKATVVGLATVEWFSQQTGGTVLFTGLNYKPSGTVAANTVFYAQARSTDPTCPTAISTSRVPATINAQSCIDTIDLALKKSINTKIARVGDVLTYTIKVWNEWTKNATGVEVVDSIATTVQFVSGSFVASRGSATISGNVIKWNIGNIAAAGDTVTLRYQVRATQSGVHLNTAEISKTDQKDKDSTPGNGKGGEDDIDQECFTVPFELCAGQKLEVSVPSTLTNVQWFKNGGTTAVATGNVVLFSEVGIYTYTATNKTCPANGCCPVIIEAGANCCPAEACVPYTVRKVKK